jgi:hypothetical protein
MAECCQSALPINVADLHWKAELKISFEILWGLDIDGPEIAGDASVRQNIFCLLRLAQAVKPAVFLQRSSFRGTRKSRGRRRLLLWLGFQLNVQASFRNFRLQRLAGNLRKVLSLLGEGAKLFLRHVRVILFLLPELLVDAFHGRNDMSEKYCEQIIFSLRSLR